MEKMRRPFQGVWNIIRFNYQFYLLAVAAIIVAIFTGCLFGGTLQLLLECVSVLSAAVIFVSLLVSWYVYDLSELYSLSWLDGLKFPPGKMLNVHAGFDETSELLSDKYHPQDFSVFDFYDPEKHTEISIRRARKVYPPFPGTKRVTTTTLPGDDGSFSAIFVILAAHEIRNETERVAFFRELTRLLQNDGKIMVTEHLRDIPNFLAYTLGFLHFHAYNTWLRTFSAARLKIAQEKKVTPFITTFILEKDGTAN